MVWWSRKAAEPPPAAGSPFTEAELAVRRPVWDALSDLFLDTDVRPGLPRMAWILLGSGLSASELETIWREELIPALEFNLSLVAGEWGYFELEWVERRIVRRRAYVQAALRRPWLRRWLRRGRRSVMDRYFGLALVLRGELLALPSDRRAEQAEAWSWLSHAYFWGGWWAGERPLPQRRPGSPELAQVFADLEPHLNAALWPGEDTLSRRQPVLQRLGTR